MNLYFLVEGVTERKLYPKWINYLLPSLTRVFSPDEAEQNNYYLISGGGFPSLLDEILGILNRIAKEAEKTSNL